MKMSTQKKLDPRINTLIKNGVKQNKRSIFLIIGDHGRDHIVTLHYLLLKARISAQPTVLWCYKKELGFSSNTKKRMKKIKRKQKKSSNVQDEDPLELFLTTTNIRYTYYKEVQNIVGNTYGMCVLQDFEALTPNILAQTIETVEGGGLVIFLIRALKSLRQLYTMNMDIHSRYRTEIYADIVSRFNERFLLSLSSNQRCLILDDKLDVLPISAGVVVTPVEEGRDESQNQELLDLKQSLKGYTPAFELVGMAKTLDQAKVVMNLLHILQEKDALKTATILASRGRGKSASLGISLSGAIAYGYSIIFVTSPSPENIKVLFETFLKGLKELGYEEHIDYDVYRSPNPEHRKSIMRVNISKDGKQVVQWIPPTNNAIISQAELLIIDEAAAIPLPMLSSLLGNYTTFISSTINGYEGTGRVLTVKLMKKLRDTYRKDASDQNTNGDIKTSVRSLAELSLGEPIRYSDSDEVEKWLNKLLCLDLCNPKKEKSIKSNIGCPPPTNCSLYLVDRDTLFSYHPLSEVFLRKIMSLFIVSHYKNSPNDIQLLSDAPMHRIFVLIEDKRDEKHIPEPICAIQVCFEGNISRETFKLSLERGIHTSGDVIPWVVMQHFRDEGFSQLSGVRIVRIATHHECIGMGYGKRSITLLGQYLRGLLSDPNNPPKLHILTKKDNVKEVEKCEDTLYSEEIHMKDINSLPPMLEPLFNVSPPKNMSWLGVSYGLTKELQSFWKSAGLTNIYIRQTPNDITGDHTCVMIQALDSDNADSIAPSSNWVKLLSWDFRRRLVELCGVCFRDLPIPLVLNVFDTLGFRRISDTQHCEAPWLLKPSQINALFTTYDLKRLDAFINSQIDHNGILDLVQPLSRALFLGQLVSTDSELTSNPNLKLSVLDLSLVQYSILLGLGLQKRSFKCIQDELSLPASQVLALFKKSISKCVALLKRNIEIGLEEEIIETAHKETTPKKTDDGTIKRLDITQDFWKPTHKTLDEDLDEAIPDSYKEIQKSLVSSINVDEHTIDPTFKAPSGFFPGKSALGVVSVEVAAPEKKRKLDKTLRTR